tara:strand:+ start:1076 stop:1480 length:405 start_codon:yes stop_codon:yes gene_type:complete
MNEWSLIKILIIFIILFVSINYLRLFKEKPSLKEEVDIIEFERIKIKYEHLKSKLPDNLKEMFKNVKLERSVDKKGYCKNKNELGIFLSYGKNEKELLDILIHEMAHVVTNNVGHTKEFWENYNLIKENIKFMK